MPGTLVITTLSDGTNSTSSTNCIQGSAKAWVNFNGTGTVAIRTSYNVSSITDNGTGNYTVNFTTALPDADYAVSGLCGTPASAIGLVSFYNSGFVSPSTTSFRFSTSNNNSFQDMSLICLSIFR